MKMRNLVIVVSVLSVASYLCVKTVTGSNYTPASKTVAAKVGIEIGDIAPDLRFKNPDGKEIALSSLKGYYVLIDFWASWCGPCRKENPNVVKAYNKFSKAKFAKAKGFKIYNVSLDNDAERWKQAIAQDGLSWPDHVSDLQGWRSAGAAQYGVQSIPANWVIDGNGIIVAKNLRGQELEDVLQKCTEAK